MSRLVLYTPQLSHSLSLSHLDSPFLKRGDDAWIDIVLSASLSSGGASAGNVDARGNEWRWSNADWLLSIAAGDHGGVHAAAGRAKHLALQLQALGVGRRARIGTARTRLQRRKSNV